MSQSDRQLIEAYHALSSRLGSPVDADLDAAILFASAATQQGQAHLGIGLLKPLANSKCRSAKVWQALGLAYREEQDMEAALDALQRAQAYNALDPAIAFAYAQTLFETGRPAANAFEAARALAPNNPILIRNSAAALSAQGQHSAAEALLLDVLDREPQWLDGHKTLAALRVTASRRDIFDASFVAATKACPQSLSLRLAHIHLLSTAKDWDGAQQVLHQAQKAFGQVRGLAIARAHILNESGDPKGDDPALFDAFIDVHDPGLDIARIRHALRLGAPALAAQIGEVYINTAHASLFWPYLSLAWRLLSDPRAAWLDGETPHVRSFDLNLSEDELAALAACLQEMHTNRAPFLEQSVQLGTQTPGQLFFRPNPEIQAIRVRLASAISDYVTHLGATIDGHPLLSPTREAPFAYDGSWSVRLQGGGFHSTHTHPKGWISSAFYVAIPKPAINGPEHAGWISFGEGPSELRLGLSPYCQIEPKPGTLVLFPSTLWHKTLPFEHGERLTIAFDIKVPIGRLMV
jgi:tetratricopeptide (TPR) repeat protein